MIQPENGKGCRVAGVFLTLCERKNTSVPLSQPADSELGHSQCVERDAKIQLGGSPEGNGKLSGRHSVTTEWLEVSARARFHKVLQGN